MPVEAEAPKVTVICIFLDAERFIEEAIDSVLGQTFDDFELLLVDDGSIDTSSTMARRFAANSPEFVKYLEHPDHRNLGMSASRNLGLAHARGELIALIDSDDVWRPEKLAEQVRLLDNDPALVMVCGTVNYWRSWSGGADLLVPTGNLQDAASWPPDTSLNLYPLGRSPAPCPTDVMFPRSVSEEIGGFEDEFTGMYEDQAFFAKIFLAGPVFFSGSVWTDYRQHERSSLALADKADGYMAIRRRFLDWFAGYLARGDPGDPGDAGKLRRAVLRARWWSQGMMLFRVESLFRRGWNWPGKTN